MKTIFRKLFISAIIVFVITGKLYSQDLMSLSNSLKYADYLFKNKQYQFSLIEYKRINFLDPNDSVARLRLVQSYRLTGDLKNAMSTLVDFFPGCKPDFPESFAEENFRIMFCDNQFGDCERFLNDNKTIDSIKKFEYKLGTTLMQNKWSEAKVMSDDYLLKNRKTKNFDAMYDVALKGIDFKYKNPYLAAILSGIVPGSGKIYTKNWKDGLYSFLFVSGFSWLTYNTLKDKGFGYRSVVYGSLALGFYSANIFGSYKSAIRFNRKANKNLTKNIQNILYE